MKQLAILITILPELIKIVPLVLETLDRLSQKYPEEFSSINNLLNLLHSFERKVNKEI